jgi:ATP-dependent Zn protease
MARACSIVQVRHGLREDARLDPGQLLEAMQLVEQMRRKAQKLIDSNFATVERIATALTVKGTLNENEINSLLRSERDETAT